jgi:hypothetical protein
VPRTWVSPPCIFFKRLKNGMIWWRKSKVMMCSKLSIRWIRNHPDSKNTTMNNNPEYRTRNPDNIYAN